MSLQPSHKHGMMTHEKRRSTHGDFEQPEGMQNVACRDDIIAAFEHLSVQHGRDIFSPAEIAREMRTQGTIFEDSTIRTHVVSRMCIDAPDHHSTVYDDLERVGRGIYRPRRS